MDKRMILLIAFFFLSVTATHAAAGSASLHWQANSESDIAGYHVYCGNAPRSYGSPIAVGRQTSYTFTGLEEGSICYFAVTALDNVGNESDYSIEVSKLIESPAPSGSSETPALRGGTATKIFLLPVLSLLLD